MSTTLNEAKVIFLIRQDWVPDDVDGHGEITATPDRNGEVTLQWFEYRGQAGTPRAEHTGLTVDEYVEKIATIREGE